MSDERGLEELANDNGEVWDGGRRDLERKLADFYGVESVGLRGDWYDDENDEMLYEVLVVYQDGEEYFIDDEVRVFGHLGSGAAGVDVDDLPERQELRDKAGVSGDD